MDLLGEQTIGLLAMVTSLSVAAHSVGRCCRDSADMRRQLAQLEAEVAGLQRRLPDRRDSVSGLRVALAESKYSHQEMLEYRRLLEKIAAEFGIRTTGPSRPEADASRARGQGDGLGARGKRPQDMR